MGKTAVGGIDRAEGAPLEGDGKLVPRPRLLRLDPVAKEAQLSAEVDVQPPGHTPRGVGRRCYPEEQGVGVDDELLPEEEHPKEGPKQNRAAGGKGRVFDGDPTGARSGPEKAGRKDQDGQTRGEIGRKPVRDLGPEDGNLVLPGRDIHHQEAGARLGPPGNRLPIHGGLPARKPQNPETDRSSAVKGNLVGLAEGLRRDLPGLAPAQGCPVEPVQQFFRGALR